jgi:hypothetical protein
MYSYKRGCLVFVTASLKYEFLLILLLYKMLPLSQSFNQLLPYSSFICKRIQE